MFAAVSSLQVQPGDRWSYRVVSINRLGIRSVPSESIVVAQPLPRPPAPAQAPGRSVAENAVVLKLRADADTEGKASEIVGTATGATISVEDILKRWQAGGMARADDNGGAGGAGGGQNAQDSGRNLWGIRGDEDGVGLTLDRIFSKFDTDGSGTIDAGELRFVLLELGAPAGPAEVEAAMERLDANRNGSISREEFAAWWRQDKFDFVVWRDAGAPSLEVEQRNPKQQVLSAGVASAMPTNAGVADRSTASGRRSSRQRSKRRTRGGRVASAGTHRSSSSSSSSPTRASSAGDLGRPTGLAALKLPRIPDGGTCFMCYRGRTRTPLIADLLPNTLYVHRGRESGRVGGLSLIHI